MGHTRLGELPRTRKWQQVVALIEGGAGTWQVANATMAAARRDALRGDTAGPKTLLERSCSLISDIRTKKLEPALGNPPSDLT